MKAKLLGLLFLLPTLSFALGVNVTLSGGSPLGTGFSTASPSLANGSNPCSGKNTVEILNQTGSLLGWGLSTTATAVPTEVYGYIPPGPNSGHKWHLDPFTAQYIYLQSPNGSATSGTVQVSCWYE